MINLINIEKSHIKYKISKFPDGQQQITITHKEVYNTGNSREEGYIEKTELRFINKSNGVTIKSRLNNFKDLELIICTVASLRNLGFKKIHLYVPYIVGARSDRKFEEGSNNYLKDIICPILNNLKLDSITCLDPHSDCLEMGLNNFNKMNNLRLIEHFLAVEQGIDYGGTTKSLRQVLDSIILISPDAGASKKIYKLAEQIGYKGDVITCSKDRDTEGKLTKTVIPVNTIVHKDYIIIDDICDGGATFINIAKILKPRLHESNRIFLIVTHGIFSKGFEELSKYFDGIYCTNSYSNIIVPLLGPSSLPFELKQLDVF